MHLIGLLRHGVDQHAGLLALAKRLRADDAQKRRDSDAAADHHDRKVRLLEQHVAEVAVGAPDAGSLPYLDVRGVLSPIS